MSDQADRPATLRRMPRPAADERVDPVDYRAGASSASPAASSTTSTSAASTVPPAATVPLGQTTSELPAPARRGRPRRELTAQFSTRLTPDVIALIDQAADQEGTTIREVVEQAIRRTWG